MIQKDHCLIPTLDEFKSKLANKKFFSVLDLKDGYWIPTGASLKNQKIIVLLALP